MNLDEDFNATIKVKTTISGWELRDYDGSGQYTLNFQAGFPSYNGFPQQTVINTLTSYDKGNQSGNVTPKSREITFTIPKGGSSVGIPIVWGKGTAIGPLPQSQSAKWDIRIWNNIQKI